MDEDFWDYLDRMVAEHPAKIDRRRGSAHPRYPELIYPLDYGYLDGTTSIDGGGLDIWIGSLEAHHLDAVALTVDLHKRDAEIKLLLGCTEVEKQIILDFLNGNSMRAWLVRRASSMALLDSRRSVRRFQPRPVPPEILRQVLEAATWAPSAHDRRPWRFAVLATAQSRSRLADALGEAFYQDLLSDGLAPQDALSQVARSRQRIQDAPAAVLLCLDASQGDSYADAGRQQAEWLMGVQSAALAGGHLLLAAHAAGLGGVWMCAPLFAPQVVQAAFELPLTWQPQALFLLGYPARTPVARSPQSLAEITLFL
jgi:coenzyme F420-0:L-glutamate ligase / coenzyme F420-1:gamma-L-glutamate ligase